MQILNLLTGFKKTLAFLFLSIAGVFCPGVHAAIEENKPVHASGNREVWDRRNDRVELFGNAAVRQPDEFITADYILLDQKLRTLTAKGSCIYVSKGTVIYGDEMHFNLDTRTGTVISGRVTNEAFALAGERINKLGEGHYQTHWGEYSTCQDCVQSWTIGAKDVDMQTEGYAFMDDVSIKVKNAPTVWLPYLILPMKTKRQSGFLFPSIGFSDENHGFMFVQPYFWAIDRSVDMTFGLGVYTKRGRRVQWQGRYALSDGYASADFFGTSDKSFNLTGIGSATQNYFRWGVNVTQRQRLPWGIDQKLKISEVSDNLYPYQFTNDVNSNGDMVLSSVLSFSYASDEVSAFIAGRRIRNLINLQDNDYTKFDETTVQDLPTAVVTTNDKFFFGLPVAAGITVGMTNFARTGPGFDYDYLDRTGTAPQGPVKTGPYTPGVDPLRKATRVSISPTLYTTVNPIDGVSVVPSVRYYSYFYNFHDIENVDNLHRRYLLFQTDATAQLERVYDTDNPEIPRIKHLIRPQITYSVIPNQWVREDPGNHPFLQQIRYARSKGFTGYNFDNYDIVPIDTTSTQNQNYFIPLGQSLSYGFTTQLVRRKGKLEAESSAVYDTPVEFSLGQAFNFRELGETKQNNLALQESERLTPPQPFSRLYSTLILNFIEGSFNRKLTSRTDYYYYPYQKGLRNQVTTSLTYVHEAGLHQQVMNYERSASLILTLNPIGQVRETDDQSPFIGCYSYVQSNCVKTAVLTGRLAYSLNDYILPSVTGSHDFVTHSFTGIDFDVQVQNPSRCWRFGIKFPYTPANGWGVNFDLSLNLTGAGFGGITEVANSPTFGIAPK